MQAQAADLTRPDALEAHLRSILESQPACLTRVSAGGAFLAVNEAAMALLGAERLDQVLGTPLFSLMRPDQQQDGRHFIERVIGGERSSLELDLVSLSGSKATLQAHGVPLPGAPDGLASALLVFRDVSEQRRLESSVIDLMTRQAELEAAHEAERDDLHRALARSREDAVNTSSARPDEQRTRLELARQEAENRLAAATAAHDQERASLLAELKQAQDLQNRAAAEHLAEKANLQRALDTFDARRRDLELAIATRDEHSATLTETNLQLKQELETVQRDLAARDEATSVRFPEHDRSSADAPTASAVDHHGAERAGFQRALNAAIDARDGLGRALDAQVAQHRSEIAALEAAVEEHRERRSELTKAMGQMTRELALAEQELARRADSLAAVSAERDRVSAAANAREAALGDQLAAAHADAMRRMVAAEAEAARKLAASEAAAAQKLTAFEAAAADKLAEADAARAALAASLAASQAELERRTTEVNAHREALQQARRAAARQQADAAARFAEAAAERQALEMRLGRDQHLADAGRLAVSLSSDLAGALTTLLDRTQALLRQGREPAEIRKDLEQARAAALVASTTVSRITGQVHGSRPLRTNVHTAIQKLDSILRGLFAEVAPAPGRDMSEVSLSEAQLQQVVIDCVIGARAAMLADGQVFIDTADLEVTERLAREHGGVPPGGHVLVSVHASSRNIADRLAHLVGATPGAAVWDDETSCLGAMYHTVAASGGHVWVTPQSANSVVFELYLPKAPTGAPGAGRAQGGELR